MGEGFNQEALDRAWVKYMNKHKRKIVVGKSKPLITGRRKAPKQAGISSDLRKRRLLTLIKLLEANAAKPLKGGLTRQEMLDWSRQTTNVLNGIGD